MSSRLSVVLVGLALFLSGCGSGGVAEPQPLPSVSCSAPVSGHSQTIPCSGSSGQGAVVLPQAVNAPPGDTVTIALQSWAPSGGPVLQSSYRSSHSTSVQSAIYVPVIYALVTFSATTSYDAWPGFTFTVGSSVNPANGPLYVAFWDPTKSPSAWQYAVEGPASVSGGNATFTGSSVSLTFQASKTYVFALYQAAGATSSTLSVSPAAVQIYGTGALNAQNILVQESGYSASFSEADTCNPSSGQIATIATSSASGPSATYSATGVNAGTCTATFSDGSGQKQTISISVTTSGWTIQTHRR